MNLAFDAADQRDEFGGKRRAWVHLCSSSRYMLVGQIHGCHDDLASGCRADCPLRAHTMVGNPLKTR